MRTWILLSMAVLIVLLILLTRGQDPVPHAAATHGERAAASKVAAPAVPGRRWTPGLDRTYAVDFTTSISGGQGFDMRVAGTLETTVVDGAGDRAVLRVQLAQPVVVAGHDPAPSAMLEEMARPWFVELDADGRIVAAWFGIDVTRGSRDLLKTVGAYLQYGNGERVEQDATGSYEAAYATAADALVRSKRRYVSIVTAHGLAAPEDVGGPEVKGSHARFELDADGWPTRVTVDEQLHISLPQTKQALTATVALRADIAIAGVRDDLVGSFAAARDGMRRYEPLAEMNDARAVAESHARQALGDATYDSLLAALHAAHDDHDMLAVQRKLRALFALRTNDVERAAALLGDASVPDAEKRTMIAGLAGAGTPEAQRALVAAMPELPSALRQQTIGSLGMVDAPTPETVSALEAIVQRPSDQVDRHDALLAIGNSAHGADDAVEWLLERLHAASSRDDVLICLRALANTGDPRVLPALQDAMQSDDREVRAAAVSGLRLIDDPSVDGVLASVLLGDRDEAVRSAAVFAAGYRSLDRIGAALGGALQHDPAAHVRMEIIEMLRGRRSQSSACDPLLAWSAQHDADARVRDAATAALRS